MTDPDGLTLAYLSSRPHDAARVLDRLEPANVAAFLSQVPARLAVAPVAAMVPWRAGRCLAAMAPEQAAAVVEGLPAEHAPDCLRAMPEASRTAILAALPGRRARALRHQLRYPAALVGAHMDAAPLALAEASTAEDALQALRGSGRGDLLQLHVVDTAGRPCGAVRLAELLNVAGERPLATLMTRDCRPLAADTPLPRVDRGRGWVDWPERPVVDGRGRLVGAITLGRLAAAEPAPQARPAAGSAPLAVLLQAYAATAAGLARLVAGLVTTRGTTRDDR